MRILTRKEFQDDIAKMWSEAVESECKDLIEKAVLAEREACAKKADEHMQECEGKSFGVGNAIRARGES